MTSFPSCKTSCFRPAIGGGLAGLVMLRTRAIGPRRPLRRHKQSFALEVENGYRSSIFRPTALRVAVHQIDCLRRRTNMPLEQLIAKLSVTPAPNEAAQEFQLDAYDAAKTALRARTRSATKVEPSSKGSIMPQAIQSPDDRVAPQRDLNYGSKADITGCYRPSVLEPFFLSADGRGRYPATMPSDEASRPTAW